MTAEPDDYYGISSDVLIEFGRITVIASHIESWTMQLGRMIGIDVRLDSFTRKRKRITEQLPRVALDDATKDAITDWLKLAASAMDRRNIEVVHVMLGSRVDDDEQPISNIVIFGRRTLQSRDLTAETLASVRSSLEALGPPFSAIWRVLAQRVIDYYTPSSPSEGVVEEPRHTDER